MGVKQSLALGLSVATANTICLSLQRTWNGSSENCSTSFSPSEQEVSYADKQKKLGVLHHLKGLSFDSVKAVNASVNKYLKH